MNVYFITFRSVTLAQRGESVLKEAGQPCTLMRSPRWMEERGCGYALRLRCARIEPWVELFQHRGVGFRKVYRRMEDGEVREVAL